MSAVTTATVSPSRGTSPPPPPPADARCLGCGYALRELASSRCPECGRAFDARDPWTMNVGRPYGRVGAFLLAPIDWPTHLAAALATFAVFWWTAGLPYAMTAMKLALAGWFAIYVYRGVRVLARLIARRVYRQPRRRHKRSFVMLALITLCGLMIWTRLPLRIMFALHRPGLEEVARHHYEKVPMERYDPPLRDRVGLYAIDLVYVDVHGAAVCTRGDGQFLYDVDAEPWEYLHRGDVHLGGPWYYHTSESQVLGWPVRYVLYLFGYY
jgi:hypothetical protein